MEEPFRQPPNASKVIDVGSIVVIHSLKSVRGAELNGKRAIVIDRDKDRWETKVEGKQNVGTETTSLKPDNLRISEKTVGMHPEYMTLIAWVQKERFNLRPHLPWPAASRIYRNARGIAYDDTPPPERARKLAELLERPDKGYSPNQTVLMGVALLFYSAVPESSLNMDCTIYDLEHIAGLISLTAMCQGEMMQAKGCGDGEPEAVLFALLEAAPMSITVLMEFLIRTPYIGPEENYSKVRDAFRTAKEACLLTPNQQNKDYCKAMRGGICLIFLHLKEDGPSKTVFIRVMIKHTLFPLLIQRLLRIVAREAMGTPDGMDLGMFARNILADIAYVDDQKAMKNLLYSAMCDRNVYLRTAIPAMLREENVTSAEILLDRLKEWIDVPAAGRYCDENLGIVR
jgi:hypothetical protein